VSSRNHCYALVGYILIIQSRVTLHLVTVTPRAGGLKQVLGITAGYELPHVTVLQ
jgi:hypothetical protein